ncbi:MAG TPA: NAD(P)-dependent oxidoreductase [Jatrophihabitantaceae bacterium]|jgi:nucleoside-diphosphate-sugar epimerase
MTKTAVVLGVGGQIGTAVARRMLDEGWQVRGLKLDDTPLPGDLAAVAVTAGDRNDDVVLAAVLAGGADAVVDTVAYNSRHGRQLLAHAGDIGALAVISSVAVYADAGGSSVGHGSPHWPAPVTEDQPVVSASDDTYGGGKLMLERTLLDAGQLPVTALRPCAVWGPGSRHLREWWFIKRVIDLRPVVPLKFGGRSRFHPSSTANIAALALHCLGLPSSQIVNAADPDCPSVFDIAQHISRAMDHRWQIVQLDDDESDGTVGDTPWTDRYPIVLDTSRATGLGYQPAGSYADTVRTLIPEFLAEVDGRDWRDVYPALAGYAQDLFDYEAEDRFLSGARLR